MNNMNLVRFEKESIELYIDTTTGESFASISGYARMAGKDKSTVSRRCQGVAESLLKQAEVPTSGGIQAVALITESLICEWLQKDNPEMATKLMQLGVRVFLHKLAGYQVTSTATQPISEDKLFAKQFIDSMYADIAERYPEIDKRLIDGAKLNGYGRHYPELKSEVEEIKNLISATSKEESIPVSPTELGVKFYQNHSELGKSPSAQKVNLALVICGLQEKSEDKLCSYKLTPQGEEYGELQIETCKGHNKTVYRVRWYESVLEVIEDTLITLMKTKGSISL